jgi:hypothetical protein
MTGISSPLPVQHPHGRSVEPGEPTCKDELLGFAQEFVNDLDGLTQTPEPIDTPYGETVEWTTNATDLRLVYGCGRGTTLADLEAEPGDELGEVYRGDGGVDLTWTVRLIDLEDAMDWDARDARVAVLRLEVR